MGHDNGRVAGRGLSEVAGVTTTVRVGSLLGLLAFLPAFSPVRSRSADRRRGRSGGRRLTSSRRRPVRSSPRTSGPSASCRAAGRPRRRRIDASEVGDIVVKFPLSVVRLYRVTRRERRRSHWSALVRRDPSYAVGELWVTVVVVGQPVPHGRRRLLGYGKAGPPFVSGSDGSGREPAAAVRAHVRQLGVDTGRANVPAGRCRSAPWSTAVAGRRRSTRSSVGVPVP